MDAVLAISVEPESYAPKIYPFNPNFIKDAKGYRLGLSAAELDRLYAFREKGKFVNTAEEFQQVTKISDSLLGTISPYFKFPDWVLKRNKELQTTKSHVIIKTDLNLATAEDLVAVYGIGPVLSERIITVRTTLGSFADFEQLSWVYGLKPEVIEKVKERFHIVPGPNFKKLKINEASIYEISRFPGFNYAISKKIVSLRTMQGKLLNADDLSKIEDLNGYNLKLIALYLEF